MNKVELRFRRSQRLNSIFLLKTQWNLLVKAEFSALKRSEYPHWLFSPLHLTVAPPEVKLYTHLPGEYGHKNTLICHVNNFYPPDIAIQLMKEGVELVSASQTDLAFKKDWHFHLTKDVAFTPEAGEQYFCMVTHGNKVTKYIWGELQSVSIETCSLYMTACWEWNIVTASFTEVYSTIFLLLFYRSKHVNHIFISPLTRKTF